VVSSLTLCDIDRFLTLSLAIELLYNYEDIFLESSLVINHSLRELEMYKYPNFAPKEVFATIQ